ncbi:MAG: hypothetical protein JST04_02100 [Bdellovibrionales bacterium]|nr:hypothetical protein [Bdellovibrionales bacterium]
MRRRARAFALSALLFFALAGGRPSRSFAADDDSATLPSRLTTDADEKLIAGWWADPGLSVGEAERRTFELVLQRRLALLPESTAKAVLLDRTLGVYFSVSRGSQTSGYLGLLRQVRIRLPEDLKNSTSYYFALMHELEHSVQLHTEGLVKTTFRPWFDWRGLYVWNAEKEAMEAEWHYLRAIPEADRLRIADELQAGPHVKEMNLEIHNHRAASRSLDEYLRDQWSVGRYSREELAKKGRKMAKAFCRKLVITAVAAPAFLAANEYCAKLRERRKDPRNAEESPTFYRYYCEGTSRTD